MDEIELLDSVLDKTAGLLDGVQDSHLDLRTPCDDYDVATLVDHIVGWVQAFAAGSEGSTYEGDLTTFHAGDDPGGQFRAAAVRLVAGWRAGGFDRKVRLSVAELPGEMVFNMTLMEYMTHGWDLAIATGQPVPYTEQEAAETLARAEKTLPPEFRGEGRSFGDIVPIDDHAPAVDRLVAFLGRKPAFSSAPH